MTPRKELTSHNFRLHDADISLIDQQELLLAMPLKKRSYEHEVDLKKLSVIPAPE
ncbi:hypothetical protein XNC3_110035 [Xenorhabdus nematophila F1]|nr:hypothetical protein XNC3_110035 [Xenorhabdus nematophila F1]